MSKNDYITGEELRQIISFAKENGYTIEEAIDIYKKEVKCGRESNENKRNS